MNTTDPYTNNSSKTSNGCIIWGVVILLVVVGLLFIPYNIQVSRYNNALDAFSNGDCQNSISIFESVSNAFYLIDYDQLASIASNRFTECKQYLDIVAYEEAGDLSQAVLGYLDYVIEERSQIFVPYALARARYILLHGDPSRYTTSETCLVSSSLYENAFFINPNDQYPSFLLNCSRVFLNNSDYDFAYLAQEILFSNYSGTEEAKSALTDLSNNPVACNNWGKLKTLSLTKSVVPALLKTCGMNAYYDKDWGSAVTYFEILIKNYPSNAATRDIDAYYAKALIEEASSYSTGTIDQPSQTGSTSSGVSSYSVTNATPYGMRIVFSGPESRVEEIPACGSCYEFTFDPLYCPSNGTKKTFTLAPGTYSILVTSINALGYVTPYTGTWNFSSGIAYSDCFYIVTR